MDGLEMLRCLQEKQPLPKVIILSAYSEFSYAQQAIKLGVSEYLIKPIIINELTQSLRSIEQQLAEESNKKGEAPELRSLEEVFSGIQSGRLPFTEKIRNYVYQKIFSGPQWKFCFDFSVIWAVIMRRRGNEWFPLCCRC